MLASFQTAIKATITAAAATNIVMYVKMLVMPVPIAGMSSKLLIANINATAASKNWLTSDALMFKNPTMIPSNTRIEAIHVLPGQTIPNMMAIAKPAKNTQCPILLSVVFAIKS